MEREIINKKNKKNRIKCIIVGIIFIIGGIALVSIGDTPALLFGVACIGVGIILFILAAKLFNHLSEEEYERIQKYEAKPALSPEQKKDLQFAQMALNHGDITLVQYEIYKSKILNEENPFTKIGMTPDQIIAEHNKEVKEIKRKQAQKQAEQTVAMHAIIGGAIGGTTGAIVGAAVGKQKAENDLNNMENSL